MNKENPSSNKYRLLNLKDYWAVGGNLFMLLYFIALFVYVALRAYWLSLTYDEIVSFQLILSNKWLDLGTTANSHLLNSALMKASMYFFGTSEWTLRLPNVLAFVLYLIYAVKISKRIKPKMSYVPLVLLTTLPLLLDFFSLARGYGLSLGFLLPSIYFLLRYTSERRFILALVSSVCGMLMVLSNFSSLNFFIPLISVLLFITIINKNKRALVQIVAILVFVGVFLAIVIPVLFELKNNGELYFGGRRSFYHDTILSFGHTSSYFKPTTVIADVIFVILFFMGALISVYHTVVAVVRKKISTETVLSALFILMVLAPNIQYLLLRTNFPIERTALIYYPVLILLIAKGIKERHSKFQPIFLHAIAFIFLLNFFFSANFRYCYTWRFESATKEAMLLLEKKVADKDKNSEVSLGVNSLFNPSVWYYSADLYKMVNFQLEVVDMNSDIHLDLEEFKPSKLGNTSKLRTKMTSLEIEKLLSPKMDYYYLHDFVVNEISRNGYDVIVLKHYKYAKSSLIKLK